jgi:uncharacterized protein YbbK (DUF523 family)
MKVAVSACLLGERCKYDGGTNLDPELIGFLKDKEYFTFCPEREGGLPTPRPPVELRDGRAVNREGEDVTEHFKKGAELVLEKFRSENPDLAIMKSRSPSCGPNGIYDGSFTGKLIPGCGYTAKILKENGYKLLPSKK